MLQHFNNVSAENYFLNLLTSSSLTVVMTVLILMVNCICLLSELSKINTLSNSLQQSAECT